MHYSSEIIFICGVNFVHTTLDTVVMLNLQIGVGVGVREDKFFPFLGRRECSHIFLFCDIVLIAQTE